MMTGKDEMMLKIPNPNAAFPNEYKTSCFIKNVITAPNITVGDYTYYDDATDPTGFERNNVLFNYPELVWRSPYNWQIPSNCIRRQVYHGTGEPPNQQRNDVPI